MGLALSVAVTAVLAYGLANVLTTDLVNTWVSAAIGSALPLASMGLLIAGTAGLAQLQPRGATDNRNRAGGADAEEKSRVASDGQQDVKRQPPSLGALLPSATLQRLSQRNRSILLRFCLCLLIAITAVEAVRNLLLSGTALTFYAGAANLLGLGLKLASTAWLLYLFETYDVRGVSAVYRVAFLMMLGVVLCIPSLLAGNWLAHTLLDLASYFFQVTMLVVAYQICVGFKVNPVMVLSLFRAVWALAALAGIGLGHAIASAHTPLGIQALTVGMGLAVAFAFTFAFTDRDCVKVLAAMPKRPAASPFRDKMRQVASRFALSERELEVMTLVAKGRSAARIADDLSVSPATVNSHVSHIYRKLGVHSRQQLLDLVERG
uniref:LuxR family transcriptional regulator n=1 Tax=Muribaculaceae bacterium Z82 TaxID=2304548 RepID=A0A7C9NVK0_9BACT